MDHIEIKRITVNEREQLQQIGRQTFQETFSDSNTEENMKTYLEQSFSDEKMTAELTNKDTEFYFATHNHHVIGYLKLNFGASQTELKDPKAVEIERIYVIKEYHGENIGQRLYETAIERAKQKKANYIWLGVWEKNQRAIRFYQKNGFVVFGQHIFKLGEEEQTDLMMKRQLTD